MSAEKRAREEGAVELAVQELEAAASRDADLKLKALARLFELLDPTDASYSAQQELLDADGATVLVQLLDEAQPPQVASKAAEVLAAAASHSQAAQARLNHRAQSFAETPEKVALNPVQASLAEEEGLMG